MFNQDLIEHLEEDQVVQFKASFSTNYTKGQFSPFPLHPLNTDQFSSPLNFSFDREINRNNALQLKSAIIAYINHCLINQICETKIFQNGSLIPSQSLGQLPQNDQQAYETLIIKNPLLTAFRKKYIQQNFKEFEELSALFTEILILMRREVSQELIFILTQVLEHKLQDFRQLQKQQTQGFLPKIDRFWQDDDLQPHVIPGSWALYQDLDYEDIKKFSSNKVEEFSSELYFSSHLKLLNLREVNEQFKPNICVMDKFRRLLVFLCENVFLSMCGMSQKEQDLQEFKHQLRWPRTERSEPSLDVLTKKVKIQ